jgi:ABC-type glutathione transport system ATPase component
MSPGDHPIVLSDLSAAYPAHRGSQGSVALRGVSLRVGPGEVLGVLGESGSGKSTMARILAARPYRDGESAPRITGGDAIVLGTSLRHAGARVRRQLVMSIGYLQQDAGSRLDRGLTVAALIAAPLFERDKRTDQHAAGVKVAAMLDSVHLPLSVLEKYPYELSAGQRQRVAIAQALVLGPSLLIADEPTMGIDVTVRDSVVDLLGTLQASRDFAAVIVSHDARVLRNSAATVAVLQAGALVGYGTMQSVFGSPDHPYVASLAEALELGD